MGFHGLMTTAELARAIVDADYPDAHQETIQLALYRVDRSWRAAVEDRDARHCEGTGKTLDQALRACLDAAKCRNGAEEELAGNRPPSMARTPKARLVPKACQEWPTAGHGRAAKR